MKFKLYWKTGETEVVEGETPEQAMTLAGYSQGAIPALDYYERVDKQTAQTD